MNKINIKKLLINIFIPILLGALVGLLTSPGSNFKEMVKPSFAPPGIIFPIVWTILYALLGLSHYIIEESNSSNKTKALLIYDIGLIVNLLWSFFFFTFKLYLFSFIWIILLIIIVIIMIKYFYEINNFSGLIQIPYLLWLIFASILNYSIFILNR